MPTRKFTPKGGSVDVHIRCVGEAEKEKAPSSRKGSTQSRQSRLQPSRTSKVRGRVASGSSTSMKSPGLGDAEKPKNVSAALDVTGGDTNHLSHSMRERSSSPPPINARVLVFEFEVRDTGHGIPLAQQQKVFEPFVQGDLGLSRKYGGTGLGLSICSQLASLMGGSISLQSEEGVGSVFTMQIPLK